jgi:hypothetical protein
LPTFFLGDREAIDFLSSRKWIDALPPILGSDTAPLLMA